MSDIKPILFNPPMVRAIREGRKTQTRRLIKNAPVLYEVGEPDRITFGTWLGRYTARFTWNGKAICGFDLPFPYEPGDILYVRETWCNVNKPGIEPDYYYFADTTYAEDYDPSEWKWRPSIHMPKEAARIFLRVTDASVGRLQEMSEKDARAEGATVITNNSGTMYRRNFIDIWEKTLATADIARYGWSANPWVWVYKFKSISKEEAYEQIR